MSPTSASTFSMAIPTTCFPFTKKKKCSELSVKNSSVTSECLSTVAAPITNAQLDWVGIALQREESWAEKTMDDTTGGFWREEAYSIFHIVK